MKMILIHRNYGNHFRILKLIYKYSFFVKPKNPNELCISQKYFSLENVKHYTTNNDY